MFIKQDIISLLENFQFLLYKSCVPNVFFSGASTGHFKLPSCCRTRLVLRWSCHEILTEQELRCFIQPPYFCCTLHRLLSQEKLCIFLRSFTTPSFKTTPISNTFSSQVRASTTLTSPNAERKLKIVSLD
jgi:hypothetical protein